MLSSVVAPVTDTFVPAFDLTLGGKRLSNELMADVISVSYTDHRSKLDEARLTLNNWDPNTRRPKYLDERFAPGTSLVLAMGYRTGEPLLTMLTGEVTEWSTSFPASSTPTLEVGAINVLNRLRKDTRSRAFEGRTDPEIAKDVAAGMKPAATIEGAEFLRSKEEREYVLQNKEYDIVFLLRRARETGYEITVKEATDQAPVLVYQPSTTRTQLVRELEYGKDLVHFAPRLSIKDQLEAVCVDTTHPKTGKIICGQATRSESDLALIEPDWLAKAVVRAIAGRVERHSKLAVRTQAEADRAATELMNLNTKSLVTATGSCVGLPTLRYGSKISIRGVDLFSGCYFVTSSTHTLGDGGYVTEFACRLENPKGGGLVPRG